MLGIQSFIYKSTVLEFIFLLKDTLCFVHNISGEDPTFFSPDPDKTKNRIRIRPKFNIFCNELLTGIFSASLKLEYVDSGLNILSKMEIILYTRCYRSDPDPEPDPVRKVPDPDPTGQKSPDPTGSGS